MRGREDRGTEREEASGWRDRESGLGERGGVSEARGEEREVGRESEWRRV